MADPSECHKYLRPLLTLLDYNLIIKCTFLELNFQEV